MPTDVVAQFAELFEGRKDAYGTENGGCCRVDDPHLWAALWEQHLDGAEPIGVYPMVKFGLEYPAPEPSEHRVKWGCVDFDVKTKGKPSWDYEDEATAHVAAINLQMVLRHLGATSWIERTRSCGRHVWTFSESWVSAPVMRRALLTACGVAGVSAREVNPKQETLSEGQLGNYLRLPYPGALAHPLSMESQYMVQGDGLGICLDDFVGAAIATRTSPETLEKIAAKYVEPVKRIEVEPYIGDDLAMERILSQLNRAGTAVFLAGPDDGDRSKGLAYVAYQARLSGLNPNEALTLIFDCDKRWGKFSERPDRDKRLAEIVERAWL